METTGRTIHLDQALVDAGLKASLASRDVVVAPNGTAALISRSQAARTTVEDLRRFLQAQDWVARVLTGVELAEQGLPTDEALAVAVSMRADDRPNEFGVRGYSDIVFDPEATLDYTGCGQHGGLGSERAAAVPVRARRRIRARFAHQWECHADRHCPHRAPPPRVALGGHGRPAATTAREVTIRDAVGYL